MKKLLLAILIAVFVPTVVFARGLEIVVDIKPLFQPIHSIQAAKKAALSETTAYFFSQTPFANLLDEFTQKVKAGEITKVWLEERAKFDYFGNRYPNDVGANTSIRSTESRVAYLVDVGLKKILLTEEGNIGILAEESYSAIKPFNSLIIVGLSKEEYKVAESLFGSSMSNEPSDDSGMVIVGMSPDELTKLHKAMRSSPKKAPVRIVKKQSRIVPPTAKPVQTAPPIAKQVQVAPPVVKKVTVPIPTPSPTAQVIQVPQTVQKQVPKELPDLFDTVTGTPLFYYAALPNGKIELSPHPGYQQHYQIKLAPLNKNIALNYIAQQGGIQLKEKSGQSGLAVESPVKETKWYEFFYKPIFAKIVLVIIAVLLIIASILEIIGDHDDAKGFAFTATLIFALLLVIDVCYLFKFFIVWLFS